MEGKRLWLVLCLLIVVIFIAVITIIAVTGRMQIYGLGGPFMTLEAYVILIGLGLIYILLFSVPTFMVYTYHRASQLTLKGKIKEALFLCGIKDTDLDVTLEEFESKNSFRTFLGPTLFNLVLLFVMWGFVFAPNGFGGFLESLTQGSSFVVGNYTFKTFNGIEFFTYLGDNASLITWAFLGAYFYTVTVFSRRWFRSDLTPGVIWKINVRLIISLVIGLLLIRVWADSPAYVAFLAGIVPDTILKWVGDRVKAVMKIEEADTPFQSSQLQREIEGINFWQADRLSEEGIENVQNLATKEIPVLLVNTRFDTPQLLHWIDQALLRYQVGERIELFHRAYIRTASDLFDAIGEAKAVKKEIVDSLNATQGEGQVGTETVNTLNNLVNALSAGPNLAYIITFWKNTSDSSKRAEVLAELPRKSR